MTKVVNKAIFVLGGIVKVFLNSKKGKIFEKWGWIIKRTAFVLLWGFSFLKVSMSLFG